MPSTFAGFMGGEYRFRDPGLPQNVSVVTVANCRISRHVNIGLRLVPDVIRIVCGQVRVDTLV
jgi:hypothetical protein